MDNKLELIKEMYDVKDDELSQRKEALKKLEPYLDEIFDLFYEKLSQKEQISQFLINVDLDELKEKQIKFLKYLLSKPFDEKLYTQISKVAITHYHIRLDPVFMSYGFHVLSESVLFQAKKESSLLPHLQLIIKYLKIAESIMDQEYFAQKNLENSPYRANGLFIAVNKLHMYYLEFLHDKESEEIKNRLEENIKELKKYRDILKEVGFDLSNIKRHYTLYFNDSNEANLAKLGVLINQPLYNLSTTSYLSITSSLMLLNSMTKIAYHEDMHLDLDVKEKMKSLILQNFGWAVEDIIFCKEEQEACDIIKMLEHNEEIFYLCIKVKDIANKLYVLESIDLLCENIKLSLFLKEKKKEK